MINAIIASLMIIGTIIYLLVSKFKKTAPFFMVLLALIALVIRLLYIALFQSLTLFRSLDQIRLAMDILTWANYAIYVCIIVKSIVAIKKQCVNPHIVSSSCRFMHSGAFGMRGNI